jgi:ribosomal protein L39E
MGSIKTLGMKKKLARAAKLADAVPIWVYSKTRVGGNVFRQHSKRRYWRRSKIKL